MKLLQLTSSLGVLTSIFLYKVCKKRCVLNTVLTGTSLIVHRNYPAKKEMITHIDRSLAIGMALSNYYYGIIHYNKYISNFFLLLCGSSYMYVRKTHSLIAHTCVHFCWHMTTTILLNDLNRRLG